MAILQFFVWAASAIYRAAAPASSDVQRPLEAGASETQESFTFSAPVSNIPYVALLQAINLTIGTPPQHFNVALALESNSFFVPSSECSGFRCDGGSKYFSNRSDTYSEDGRYASTDYWAVNYRGHLSRDVVNIGGLELANKTFEEYRDSSMRFIGGWDYGFEGMLGLAPPWSKGSDHAKLQYPNLLTLLKEEEKLKQNVFSLKIPQTLHDLGDFTLGGTNPDLHTGPFRNVSFLPPDSDDYIRNAYNLPLNSITFNTSIPIHVPTPKYAAMLASEPHLILPSALARNITKTIGAKELSLWFDYIPCDRRPYLPELTFDLGGQNFTIDAFDYTFEWDVGRGYEPLCVLWIGPADDYSLPDGVIVLGTSFLKRWYSRFDLDEKKIGFADVRN